MQQGIARHGADAIHRRRSHRQSQQVAAFVHLAHQNSTTLCRSGDRVHDEVYKLFNSDERPTADAKVHEAIEIVDAVC